MLILKIVLYIISIAFTYYLLIYRFTQLNFLKGLYIILGVIFIAISTTIGSRFLLSEYVEEIRKLILLNLIIPIFLFLFNKIISYTVPNFFSLLKGQIQDIKQKINNTLIYARWFYFIASFLVMYGANFASTEEKENNDVKLSFNEIILYEDDEQLVSETVNYIEEDKKEQLNNLERETVLTIEYFKNEVIFNGLQSFTQNKSDSEIETLKSSLFRLDAKRIITMIDSSIIINTDEISDSLYYKELDELNFKLSKYILNNKEKIASNTI